ncbi:hypothetical protein Pint_13447 [Pistacia integerrima]|uniref:Uncharacterized protein n=1 Tax=Pistacia integerrima TaxID=434235 RepID=A0ACC0Y5D1_9ROSI|nr:hypothetical protein Pint_13447 [Pistacia integerrima]
MDLNTDQPPFWSQPITSMPRRRSSAPLLPLPILIVLLPIIALLILFFALPPFLTVTLQIIRLYGTVKKGWDSLNIVLVLFAILCGIFAKRNNDGSNTDNNVNNVPNISDGLDKNVNQPHSKPWFGDHFSNTKIYDRPISTAVTDTSRLRRSSSSYPDLRQDGLWETDEDRFRFFDDFDVQNRYRSHVDGLDNNSTQQVLRRTRSDFEEYSQVKVVPVDTFVLRSSHVSPPKSPTPPPQPPPPPPPPVVRHGPRRTYQTVGLKERNVECDVHTNKVKSPPPAAPPPGAPPPPPPPVQMGYRSEHKYVKIERIKSNATKEIKMVFASLYNQRKRIKKKHMTNNTEEYGKSFHSPPEPPQYSSVPPLSSPPLPPPVPPHPSSVFQNLFKKSSKSKKVHSVPPPTPPPPPPLRSTKRRSPAPPPPPAPQKPPPQPLRRRKVATSGKPPLSTRVNNSYNENPNSGNQSPLIPVPPPPPPFKMPECRFVVRGDFVSLHSGRNSRCGSPDLEKVDNDVSSTKESMDEKVKVIDGEDGLGSVFCPSPDVNIKADTFIARLRDGWRLEKMNSLREKRKMGSGPGPSPDPLQI